MAAVDDLIAQIEDPALRERLAREVAELQRTRKFGLVFNLGDQVVNGGHVGSFYPLQSLSGHDHAG